jgi:uncharacterized protein YndB with AHSA1/START domain
MTQYRFLTVWLLDAPIEQVWQAIADYQHLPTWWPSVTRIVQLEPGAADGVGSKWQMTWKTPLSYTLTFDSQITQIEPPTLLAITATGDVEGTGRWELSTAAEGTLVHYYWTVSTTKAWMNALALLIRPVMEWNHDATMRQGGIGLAKFLGVQLLKAEAVDPRQ